MSDAQTAGVLVDMEHPRVQVWNFAHLVLVEEQLQPLMGESE